MERQARDCAEQRAARLDAVITRRHDRLDDIFSEVAQRADLDPAELG